MLKVSEAIDCRSREVSVHQALYYFLDLVKRNNGKTLDFERAKVWTKSKQEKRAGEKEDELERKGAMRGEHAKKRLIKGNENDDESDSSPKQIGGKRKGGSDNTGMPRERHRKRQKKHHPSFDRAEADDRSIRRGRKLSDDSYSLSKNCINYSADKKDENSDRSVPQSDVLSAEHRVIDRNSEQVNISVVNLQMGEVKQNVQGHTAKKLNRRIVTHSMMQA